MPDVSELIVAANQGAPGAVDQLYQALYADLRELAHSRLRGTAKPAMLGTTALVHESYLRLVKRQSLRVEDRAHFLAYAAHVMRSVVVDLVREGQALRRGGGQAMISLDQSEVSALPGSEDEVLRVHEALEELGAIEPRLVQVVEMRYFVGLDMAEISEALGVGKRTVERDWEKARSFLFASLQA